MNNVKTLEEFLSLNYELKITPYKNEDEHGFVITCPEINGIEVFGESIEEAFEELKEAKIAIYEMNEELDEPIYYPSKHFSFEPRPSGRLTVRLPIGLHEEVRNYAKENLISLNVSIIDLLTKGLYQIGYETLMQKMDNIETELKSKHRINLIYQDVERKVESILLSSLYIVDDKVIDEEPEYLFS